MQPGQTISLEASATTDPDGHPLQFSWSIYPSSPTLNSQVRIEAHEAHDTMNPKVIVSPDLADSQIPLLLTVTDQGKPPLTRYGRILIMVRKTTDEPNP